MRRVLHIITGLSQGGAETVLCRLCEADRQTHHQVICLTGQGYYGARLARLGIRVSCLDMAPGRLRLRDFVRLCRLVREADADVVQCWMYHADLLGGLAARWAGQRNIIWGIRHSGFASGGGGRKTRLVRWLCACISAVVPRRILCCAHSSLAVHVACGYDARRMVAVPNGIDAEAGTARGAEPAALRARLGLSPQTPLIGMVARYHRQKDHGTLLSALALLRQNWSEGVPAPVCLLAGSGMVPENTALMQLARTCGVADALVLLGPQADVRPLITGLDLHVLSSHSGEGCPNVLLEAMACGTPCVATDVGDAARIVADTGVVVPPGRPHELARAISGLLAERGTEAWSARQAAARLRILEKYSMAAMVRGYHRVWFGDESPQPAGTVFGRQSSLAEMGRPGC